MGRRGIAWMVMGGCILLGMRLRLRRILGRGRGGILRGGLCSRRRRVAMCSTAMVVSTRSLVAARACRRPRTVGPLIGRGGISLGRSHSLPQQRGMCSTDTAASTHSHPPASAYRHCQERPSIGPAGTCSMRLRLTPPLALGWTPALPISTVGRHAQHIPRPDHQSYLHCPGTTDGRRANCHHTLAFTWSTGYKQPLRANKEDLAAFAGAHKVPQNQEPPQAHQMPSSRSPST